MRAVRVLTLLLLSVPAASPGEDHGSQYRDVLTWGSGKESFNVALGIRGTEGAFTVSKLGFRWIQLYTNDTALSPLPWQDLISWSCRRGLRVSVRIRTGTEFDIRFKRDDLIRVVNNYLRKYAPEALDPSCDPANL